MEGCIQTYREPLYSLLPCELNILFCPAPTTRVRRATLYVSQTFTFQGLPLTLTAYRRNQMDPSHFEWVPSKWSPCRIPRIHFENHRFIVNSHCFGTTISLCLTVNNELSLSYRILWNVLHQNSWAGLCYKESFNTCKLVLPYNAPHWHVLPQPVEITAGAVLYPRVRRRTPGQARCTAVASKPWTTRGTAVVNRYFKWIWYGGHFSCSTAADCVC